MSQVQILSPRPSFLSEVSLKFTVDATLTDNLSERAVAEIAQAVADLELHEDVQSLEIQGATSCFLSSYQDKGIRLVISNGGERAEFRLLWASLRVPLKEYEEVIEAIIQVGSSGTRDRYEAMDYGKKVVHDEAGELIQELLEDFVELPLAAARSLFTLLFLCKSTLPADLVRYHKSHF